MPLGATGQAAFNLMKAAEDAASDAYFAANADSNGAITQAQQPGLVEAIRVAGLNALFAHMIGVTVVPVAVASVSLVVPGTGTSGPGAGTGALT